jgi:hypothetical protein
MVKGHMNTKPVFKSQIETLLKNMVNRIHFLNLHFTNCKKWRLKAMEGGEGVRITVANNRIDCFCIVLPCGVR